MRGRREVEAGGNAPGELCLDWSKIQRGAINGGFGFHRPGFVSHQESRSREKTQLVTMCDSSGGSVILFICCQRPMPKSRFVGFLRGHGGCSPAKCILRLRFSKEVRSISKIQQERRHSRKPEMLTSEHQHLLRLTDSQILYSIFSRASHQAGQPGPFQLMPRSAAR